MAVFAPPQLNNFLLDYVVSGCVWTGDALGSTKAASMTAGTVCIAGNFYAVAAVTARTFTASKDTYIDVDSTGTVIYTEATNNAASPALAAGSIRIGIIVTGASNIAGTGSVNQGQETIILPIASSIPYTVTDSLGNLICPRDPQRKLLGYRQILSNVSTANTTEVQATGLTCPVIVPVNRKIKITFYTRFLQNSTTGQYARAGLWDGVVASGTELQYCESNATNTVGPTVPTILEAITTPAATSKTYNVGISNDGGSGTTTVSANSTSPAFIKVELE